MDTYGLDDNINCELYAQMNMNMNKTKYICIGILMGYLLSTGIDYFYLRYRENEYRSVLLLCKEAAESILNSCEKFKDE